MQKIYDTKEYGGITHEVFSDVAIELGGIQYLEEYRIYGFEEGFIHGLEVDVIFNIINEKCDGDNYGALEGVDNSKSKGDFIIEERYYQVIGAGIYLKVSVTFAIRAVRKNKVETIKWRLNTILSCFRISPYLWVYDYPLFRFLTV